MTGPATLSFLQNCDLLTHLSKFLATDSSVVYLLRTCKTIPVKRCLDHIGLMITITRPMYNTSLFLQRRRHNIRKWKLTQLCEFHRELPPKLVELEINMPTWYKIGNLNEIAPKSLRKLRIISSSYYINRSTTKHDLQLPDSITSFTIKDHLLQNGNDHPSLLDIIRIESCASLQELNLDLFVNSFKPIQFLLSVGLYSLSFKCDTECRDLPDLTGTSSLQHLSFECFNGNEVRFVNWLEHLPQSLRTLTVTGFFPNLIYHSKVLTLPAHLEVITLKRILAAVQAQNYLRFPESLQSLDVDFYVNRFDHVNFPPNLKRLKISHDPYFWTASFTLPAAVEELTLYGQFGIMFENVTHLHTLDITGVHTFTDSFVSSLATLNSLKTLSVRLVVTRINGFRFPTSLERLGVKRVGHTQDVNDVVNLMNMLDCPHLQYLCVQCDKDNCFTYECFRSTITERMQIPQSVTHLQFINCCVPLDLIELPPTLCILDLGPEFTYSLCKTTFPSTINEIWISHLQRDNSKVNTNPTIRFHFPQHPKIPTMTPSKRLRT